MKAEGVTGAFAICCMIGLFVYGCLRTGTNVGTQAAEKPASGTPAGLVSPQAAQPVDLGSTRRCDCDCDFRQGGNYMQPEGCRLKDRPDLVGLSGYVKTSTPPIVLGRPPWPTAELRQTGPNKWEPVKSARRARTTVRVLEARLDDGTSVLKGRLRVEDEDASSRRESWISIDDFEPVPWWRCPPDKAVLHSPTMMRPRTSSRPVSLATGRWIEQRAPHALMCWTFVKGAGVYCDARMPPRSMSDDTWIFQPDELEVEY